MKEYGDAGISGDSTQRDPLLCRVHCALQLHGAGGDLLARFPHRRQPTALSNDGGGLCLGRTGTPPRWLSRKECATSPLRGCIRRPLSGWRGHVQGATATASVQFMAARRNREHVRLWATRRQTAVPARWPGRPGHGAVRHAQVRQQLPFGWRQSLKPHCQRDRQQTSAGDGLYRSRRLPTAVRSGLQQPSCAGQPSASCRHWLDPQLRSQARSRDQCHRLDYRYSSPQAKWRHPDLQPHQW